MTKTLLLADDSVTIQKVVGISFASEDITLITVDNGDDAISEARKVRPDAILADVVMPGKNGYEVCEAIKADPDLRHIPVLLLTGTFEAYDEVRARQVGACGHVSKPFEAQTLVEKVKQLLSSEPDASEAEDPAGVSSGESTADDPASFDFFDEELGDSTTLESGEQTRLIEPDNLGTGIDPLALDDSETAVVTSAASAARPASIPMAERTIAMMPTDAGLTPEAERESDEFEFELEPEASGIGTAGGDFLAPDPPPPPGAQKAPAAQSAPATGTGPTAPVGPPPDSGLDFDFESTTAGNDDWKGLGSSNLAEATILDPTGASGFDVSSSDLGDAFAPAPSSEPRPAPEPPPPAPEPPPPAPQVAAAPPPVSSESVPPPEAGPEATVLAEIAPRLRQQLHDTLEKIAWESFSDVTEKIVRQALEKVEAIAWEVIPHLAETLVREEIRRMKGESEKR